MNLHKKTVFDPSLELNNASHELFCQRYVGFDVEGEILNSRARKLKSYRIAFDCYNDLDNVITSRVNALMRRDDIKSRIEFLYNEYNTGIESKFKWTEAKATDVLVELVYDKDIKPADRISSIKELNRIKGIEAKEEVVEKTDSISEYFKKVGRMIG